MNTKTISYLREKLWYRLIKVIYIFSFIYCIGASMGFAINEFDSNYIVISLFTLILFPILTYIGFEIIRRSFYYIVIGTIQPIDDNYLMKLKKYKFLISGILIILLLIILFLWFLGYQIEKDQQKNKAKDVSEFPESHILSDSPQLRIKPIKLNIPPKNKIV
ncbi:MAG: hypothetical protein Q8N21_02955 [bacterium]|nr:hypothetical protein [bacterium]